MFKIQLDVTPLAAAKTNFKSGPKKVEQATISSLNWVGRRAMTQVKRGLVNTTGMPFGRIEGSSRGLRFKPAMPGQLFADIIAKSDWTPLGYFKPKQGKGGVRASAWRDRKLYRGAFIITFNSGYTGVFRHDDPTGKRITRTRINPKTGRPQKYTSQVGGLDELWGPSLQREMQREPIPQLWEDSVSALWPARFGHELNRVLVTLQKPK